MASFNRVILLGNMTRDPELRYIPSGTAVTEIGLAVNDRRKGANGEWIEETTFVDVTLWGRTAEVATEYLRKGSPVLIEGRLKLDTWQDKEGQKRSKLRVIGEQMRMLGSKGQGGGGKPAARGASYDESEYGAPADTYGEPSGASAGMQPPEDDIPF
jgi:single-strand DNA-binding protein